MTSPITGNDDLDAFLYDIEQQVKAGPAIIELNGRLETEDGTFVGYKFKYIHIKYADDNIGTNLSDSPTNRFFYGVRNTDDTVESTNPADYTWYQATGGFGVSNFLYYQILGGRRIEFQVSSTDPGDEWTIDPGTFVELDIKQLSDLSADLGTIVAGNAILGNNPAISGTTMTGAGLRIEQVSPTVTAVAIGNASRNIVFNGTDAFINGFQASVTGSANAVVLGAPGFNPNYNDQKTILSFVATASTVLAIFNADIVIAVTPGVTFCEFRLTNNISLYDTVTMLGISGSYAQDTTAFAHGSGISRVPYNVARVFTGLVEGRTYELRFTSSCNAYFRYNVNLGTGELQIVGSVNAGASVNYEGQIYQIEV